MEVEEIETISVKSEPWWENDHQPHKIIVKWTESDGIISSLEAIGIDGPAIINGKPCMPGRRFTKESFDKIMAKIK